MAVSNEDLARLIVTLEVSTTRLYNGLRRAQQQTNTTANNIQRRLEGMASSLDRTFANLGQRLSANLTGPLATVGAAFSVREIIRYADTWTEAGNRIRAAGEIVGLQARPLEQLRALADQGRTGFNETIQLYSRLLRSAGNVAESEIEIARATDIVNKAFKAGGAATSEMNAGILQLGQGLASGFLQGDELRSVRENAPVLAQVIADYFKVSIGGLKELGAEGELTSDKVFKAILSGQKQIEAAFATTNRTIGDSFRLVENALIQYIGQADKANGATAIITQALTTLADNFSTAVDVALQFASIIAGAILGRSLVGLVGGVRNAVVVLGELVVAMRTASTAGASLGTVLGRAIGPLSILLGGTAAFAFQAFAAEAAKAAAQIEEVTTKAEELGFASGRTAKEIREAATSTGELTEETRKLAEAERLRDIQAARSSERNLRGGAFADNLGEVLPVFGTDTSELRSAFALANRSARLLADSFAGITANERTVLEDLRRLNTGLRDSTIPAREVRDRLLELQQIPVSEEVIKLLDATDKVAEQIQQTEFVLDVKADTTEVDEARNSLQSFLTAISNTNSTFPLSETLKSALAEIVTQFDGTEEAAKDVLDQILDLAEVNPEFGPFIGRLLQLTGTFTNLADEANRARMEAQAVVNAANFRTSLRGQADRYVDGLERRGAEASATTSFVTEQNRLLGLTEDQLKLEKEIVKVKKEATEAGANITEEQALKFAQERLDLEKRYKTERSTTKTDAEKFLKDLDGKEREVDLLEAELAFRRELDPLLGDYARRLEEFKIEQELLNEAKEAGIVIDDKITERIKEQATLRAAVNAELQKLQESEEKLKETTQEWLDLAKSATRSIIDDLIEGKTAAEAFGGALQQLGSFLIDLGLNSIFGKVGGDTGIASLFNIGKRERGGPVSSGQAYIVGEKRPEVFVPNENGVIIPRVPNNLASGGGTTVPISISIDATGADAAGLARLQGEVLRLRAEIPSMVRQVTQNRIKKGW